MMGGQRQTKTRMTRQQTAMSRMLVVISSERSRRLVISWSIDLPHPHFLPNIVFTLSVDVWELCYIQLVCVLVSRGLTTKGHGCWMGQQYHALEIWEPVTPCVDDG